MEGVELHFRGTGHDTRSYAGFEGGRKIEIKKASGVYNWVDDDVIHRDRET